MALTRLDIQDGEKGVKNKTIDAKGVIKDDENRKEEISADLSANEISRITKIATIFGQVLEIGRFKKGPEAARLSMDQSKIGRAANAPAGLKPPEKREGLNIPDWAKWLGALGLIALAAKDLFDKLGASGSALSKIALKLAPYLGKIARIGTAIFDGIGRAI